MVQKDHNEITEALCLMRHYDKPERSFESAIKYKHKLWKLNDRLILLEKGIVAEANEIYRYGMEKIADKNSIINDFECEIEFSFYLSGSDPLIKELPEIEDVLMVTMCGLFLPNSDFGLADGENHNDLGCGNAFEGTKLCWAFHSLYDHSDLAWNEMARCEEICVDIKTEFQYCENR